MGYTTPLYTGVELYPILFTFGFCQNLLEKMWMRLHTFFI